MPRSSITKPLQAARKLAKRGGYNSWRGVVEALPDDERRTLMIWIRNHDKDELMWICHRARTAGYYWSKR